MYKKIKRLNNAINLTTKKLNINNKKYTLDDIYVLLMDDELLDLLEEVFKNCKSINEQSLSICNKFECEVIKMYLQLTEKKVIARKKTRELKYFDNNLDIYYHDIKKYDFLSEEKERKLLESYKLNKDEKSKELLVGAYQQLIIGIAKKWTNDDYLLLDLVQSGNIGLINTIENYDLKYNVRLGTLAYKNICNMICRAFYKYKYSNMHGYDKYELKDKIGRFIDDYFYKNSIYPSDEEIINELNITKEEFEYVKHMNILKSLNEEIFVDSIEEDSFEVERNFYEDEVNTVGDSYDLEFEVEERDLEKRILKICEECLNKKELIVMKNILVLEGNDKNQSDLVGAVGTSRQYVSFVKNRAINKLKKNKKIKRLVKEYYGN